MTSLLGTSALFGGIQGYFLGKYREKFNWTIKSNYGTGNERSAIQTKENGSETTKASAALTAGRLLNCHFYDKM